MGTVYQAEQSYFALIHASKHVGSQSEECRVCRMAGPESVLVRREQVMGSKVRVKLLGNDSIGDFGYGRKDRGWS